MIFQASHHHHHQTHGHTPEATALSSVTHTPQHSNLTSPPPPPLSWVDHHPASTSHAAEFAAASAAVAHTHFNNNMMLTDIHPGASPGVYQQPLGSPSSSTGYPLHNGTTTSNVPSQPTLVSYL